MQVYDVLRETRNKVDKNKIYKWLRAQDAYSYINQYIENFK